MANSKLKHIGLIGGQTLFSIAFILLIIAAADKFDFKVDWSLSGSYSLHPATIRICNDVKKPTRIIGVWNNNPDRGSQEAYIVRHRQSVEEKLQHIASKNELISYEFVDYLIDKPRLKELEPDIGTAGNRNIYIIGDNEQLIKVPYGSHFDRKLENNVGSALLALQRNKKIKVSLLSGHGELSPNADSNNSIAHLLNAFNSNGIEVQILDPSTLSRLGRIPQDSILFIAGPRSALGTETVNHIETFLQSGGNALILADINCPKDFSALLRRRGVMTGNGIVYPIENLDFLNPDAATRSPRVILSSEHAIIGKESRYDRLSIKPSESFPYISKEHPVTARSFEASNTLLFPYSSLMLPLIPDKLDKRFNGFKQRIQELGTKPYSIYPIVNIAGPRQIWHEDIKNARKYKEFNQEFSATLGIAITYNLGEDSVSGQKESRMIVLASRAMAADGIISQSKYSNELLLIDAISWLGFNENSSEIPSSSFRELQVECSEETLGILFYVLVIFIPLGCLGYAILMWWDRR